MEPIYTNELQNFLKQKFVYEVDYKKFNNTVSFFLIKKTDVFVSREDQVLKILEHSTCTQFNEAINPKISGLAN